MFNFIKECFKVSDYSKLVSLVSIMCTFVVCVNITSGEFHRTVLSLFILQLVIMVNSFNILHGSSKLKLAAIKVGNRG